MYARELNAILDDLDLREGVTVELDWRNRAYLRKATKTVGGISYRLVTYGHHSRITDGRSKVTVALRQPYKMVITTLAHELRHLWQYHTGRLVYTDGDYYWDGKLVSKSTEYEQRPEEIDAFAYEDDVWARLFTDQEPLGAADLFLDAW